MKREPEREGKFRSSYQGPKVRTKKKKRRSSSAVVLAGGAVVVMASSDCRSSCQGKKRCFFTEGSDDGGERCRECRGKDLHRADGQWNRVKRTDEGGGTRGDRKELSVGDPG